MSIASGQESQGTAFRLSYSTSTADQEPLSSSQSNATASKESSDHDHPKSQIPTDARASENMENAEAPGSLASNSGRQTEAQCQTFKIDSIGMLRPRDPAEAFKTLSPSICRPRYFANRRSVPFIIHDETDQVAASARSLDRQEIKTPRNNRQIAVTATHSLKRSSSLVKLSMDADGSAQVTPRTGNTPSPPHQKSVVLLNPIQRSRSGFQRSLSAIECGTLGDAHELVADYLTRRPPLGRSRDARTWEFYCDSDARDALNKQAEREQSGSATAAIGLIRSRSSTDKSLASNPNRRNARMPKNDSAKRHKINKVMLTKPKLGRATSSIARLQSTSASDHNQTATKSATKHGKSNSQSAVFEDYNGDSDKENWEPGTQLRRLPRRRPVTSQNSARILLESLREPSEPSSFEASADQYASKSRQRPSASDDKENQSLLVDNEVIAPVDEQILPRVEEDLNCVQGLLRLRQAAWN